MAYKAIFGLDDMVLYRTKPSMSIVKPLCSAEKKKKKTAKPL